MLLPPLPATLAALGGLGSLLASLWTLQLAISARTVRLVVGGLAAMLLLVGLDRGATNFPEPARATPLVLVVTVLTMLVLLMVRQPRFDRFAVIVAVVVLAFLSIEVMTTFGGNLFGLDVYRSHEAAADAVRAGENPYTDAVVVVDGSPNAEPGDLIVGYSYPPVSLAGYVAGDLLAGDPRWVSVFAISGVVGSMAWVGFRRFPDVVGLVLLLLVAVPLNRAIVWSGWTEPVSLVLLVSGVMLWRREWLSPLLLGLALASKQYLVVLVPLIVMVDTRPWRRSLTTLGVAGLTLVPALIADASSFWFTMVTRPLGLGFRVDTRSLSGAFADLGVSFEIPTWVMLGGVLAVSGLLARRIHSRSDLLAAIAVVLTVTFTLSLAFTNYWWLVQWLAGMSAVMAVVPTEEGAVIRSGVAASA